MYSILINLFVKMGNRVEIRNTYLKLNKDELNRVKTFHGKVVDDCPDNPEIDWLLDLIEDKGKTISSLGNEDTKVVPFEVNEIISVIIIG